MALRPLHSPNANKLVNRVLAVGAILITSAVCACSRAPEPDYFAEGEQLYLNGDYDAAIECFKKVLLRNPDHAGAHWYLGTCYLYSEKQNWLGIAQGELETALALFHRQGKVNPIPRFNATYFEMMCHINQAKVYLRLVQAIVDNPGAFPNLHPRVVIPRLLDRCAEEAAEAEKVAPGNADVENLKSIVEKVRKELDRQPAPRTAPKLAI